MNKGLSYRVSMGVVFVGTFALTTGGDLLSAETSEVFFFFFLPFQARPSQNPLRHQEREKGKM